MAIFSVAILFISIGFGLSASSVRAGQQQNKTEVGDLKHLFSLDGMRENQNVLAEKVSGIGTNLEKQIESVFTKLRDNQNVMSMKMLRIEAKLEKQNENDNQNGLTTKLENGIRDNQKALSLIKKMIIHFHLPIFRWNAYDCHSGIVINESTNAIQRNATGTEDAYCSCQAVPIQMPSAAAVGRIGIIYTEYRILAQNGPRIIIGLSTKERQSFGGLVGDDQFSLDIHGNGQGSTVFGCGVNWAKRQVFFTENGQRISMPKSGQLLNLLYVAEGTADLYPTVSLPDHGDAVEANFGPNFEYDLSKEFGDF